MKTCPVLGSRPRTIVSRHSPWAVGTVTKNAGVSLFCSFSRTSGYLCDRYWYSSALVTSDAEGGVGWLVFGSPMGEDPRAASAPVRQTRARRPVVTTVQRRYFMVL